MPALSLVDVTCTFVEQATIRASATPRCATSRSTVGAGEFVSVVGPTGCGKSTLLNVAAGLLEPSSARVAVFGQPLAGINRARRLHVPDREPDAVAHGAENVMAGLQFRGAADAAAQADAWLKARRPRRLRRPLPAPAVGRHAQAHVSLAQTLALDPDIILMDEPFSALDIQTRQLMENEVLALWAAKRKAVLFITHDLDEAIALSDRVVVLSAGPATRPIGEFAIDLPRPRDVAEVRTTPRFVELHQAIWAVLREEVLKGYGSSSAA